MIGSYRNRFLLIIVVCFTFAQWAFGQSSDSVQLGEVIPASKLGNSSAGFGNIPAAFISDRPLQAQLPLNHPLLEGFDPKNTSFAEWLGDDDWRLVPTRVDEIGGAINSQFEKGKIYSLVGASSFPVVRDHQNQICLDSSHKPKVLDQICSTILCPAATINALNTFANEFGADHLGELPAAAGAAGVCNYCTNSSFDQPPLECKLENPSIWKEPPVSPKPFWPHWQIWKSITSSSYCSAGEYKVGSANYDLTDALPLPSPFGATDIRAEVRYPAIDYGSDKTPVNETFPLVVFLHGNHCVCGTSGTDCANHSSCPIADRIPNHRGYDYLMEVLASRGYVSISIDGFDVTAKNSGPTMTDYEARARLILSHLRHLKDWRDSGGGPIDRIAKAVDFSQIGLIGHSRGGEAVAAADVINDVDGLGFDIKAIVAIAPTDQDHTIDWVPINNYLVLLPNNDGDVRFLNGQQTYDRAFSSTKTFGSEKTGLWIFGANHNFFNTTWTPGSGDPFASDDGIGNGRMSARAQRKVGCETMSVFLDKELKGDKRAARIIRGDEDYRGLDGVEIHTAHSRGDSLIIDNFDHGNGVSLNSLGGDVSTSGGFSTLNIVPFIRTGTHPSFRGATSGLIIGSTGAGSYETALPANRRDVRRFKELTLRLAQLRVTPTQPSLEEPAELAITLVDSNGMEADARFPVTQVQTTPYPAAGGTMPTIPTTIRVRLDDFKTDNLDFNFSSLHKVRVKFEPGIVYAIDDIALENRGLNPFPWLDEAIILSGAALAKETLKEARP